MPSDRAFITVGDWNLSPEEAAETGLTGASMALECVRDPEGKPEPTRWDSNRSIDWLITNDTYRLQGLQLTSEHWSDHRALAFGLTRVQNEDLYRAVPTAPLCKPSYMDAETWTKMIRQSWPGLESRAAGRECRRALEQV